MPHLCGNPCGCLLVYKSLRIAEFFTKILPSIVVPWSTVLPKSKEQTDLELIKWSITRLLISSNFLIITLIVRKEFVLLSTYYLPSFILRLFLSLLFLLLLHAWAHKVSILIYFVSAFTLQNFFLILCHFNKLNLPTPLHLPHSLMY